MLLQYFLPLCFLTGLKAVPLLMSWTTSIKLIEDTEIKNITTVTPTTTLAIAVDYHYKRGEFYFSDGLGRISRGWLRPSNNSKPIVIVEVKLVDGLAVDWISDSLYWADVSRKTVEMSTLDGLNRIVLFNSTHGVDKPRGIIIDPSQGLLFWSDWGENPRVESSGLDGKEMKTIVTSDLTWPNGLALDLKSKKLFILDGFKSTLSACNYDGSKLQVISRSRDSLQQAYGLTFYANRLYWGSWRSRTFYSLTLATGKTDSVFERTDLRGILERIMGVKAVHPSLQIAAPKTNPCLSAGCSHKCLMGRNLTATCFCPYGFTLNSDNKTCVEQGYLLVSWRLTIRRHNFFGTDHEPMIDGTKAAISIDYHYKKDLVFWSDIEEHRIYRAPLGQLNNKTVVSMAEMCDGLAVDWVHDVLYWTDAEHNTLEVAQLDGSNHMILFSDDLDNPRAVALDPFVGFIFWTDWGTSPKIERAVLDGSNRKTIVSDNLFWPNGLTIDYDQERIYWTDGKLGAISSSSYDGSSRKNIMVHFQLLPQPFGISLFQDNIYWTEWSNRLLLKADKTNPDEISLLANSSSTLVRPNAVRVVHSALQKEQKNPCESLKCQGLCLGSTTPMAAHCMGEQVPHPDVDAGTDSNSKQTHLTTKVSSGSIEVSLTSSKTPSLAVITTKCIKREGCKEDKRCSGDGEKIHVFTNQKSFNVSGLLPATHYDVDFKSSEHNEKVDILTSVTDTPETPKMKPVEVKGRNTILKWHPVDTCIPGFQSYHYKLFKTGSDEVILEGSTNLTEVTVQDLEPGVDFTAHVYTLDSKVFSSVAFSSTDETPQCKKEELLCDGKEDCTDGSDEAVEICASIENVIIYAKSTAEVYFRCKVRNSTRKQMDQFIVDYSVEGNKQGHAIKVAVMPCVMWPESYCFNVSSLTKETVYNFGISIALKEGKTGDRFYVSTITKEEVSGPPEDVRVISYTPTSIVMQCRHPIQANGIVRNFIVNIEEVKTYEKEKCCQVFPIFESPVMNEEPVYEIETAGFLPASTYAISIAVKTIYIGGSKAITVHTPPPPMEVMRQPKVSVSSLTQLSWQPNTPSDEAQYHALITSYLLIQVSPKVHHQQSNASDSDLGPLQPWLEEKFGVGFKVLWNKHLDDTAAFQRPIEVRNLVPRKQYELAWVQVSQYEDVYGIDFIRSDPFIAV